MTTLATPLTAIERAELERNEQIITKGLKSFIAVGLALRTIRDKRLYRDEATTFDVYCQQKWGFRDKRAYQMIAGAAVAENLAEDGVEPPQNERQTRELAPLTEDEQKIVWHVVRDTAPDGKITNDHVKSVVTVFKNMIETGALDDGSGEMLRVNQLVAAAITEETYERFLRQKQALVERIRKQDLRRAMQKKMELTDLLKIKVTITDDEALSKVPRAHIEYYLMMSNWRAYGGNAYFDFYEHRGPGHHRAHVPLNLPQYADYSKYIRECIEAIAEAENRSQLGVYYDLMALVIPESIMESKVSITA